jgi:glycosyltransferase involved in cell wall biosynthesis
MRECDALILPSVEEGSALVTYEARACGCVLLVSCAAGAVGRNGMELLLHEPRNTGQLSAQLSELVGNRTRLEELRQASLASIGMLTWRHAAGVLMERYRQALQEQHVAQVSLAPADPTLDSRSYCEGI